MKYSIKEVENIELVDKITPNVIYNRFDLFINANFKLFHYLDNSNDIFFEVLFSGKSAQLGIWLMRFEPVVLKRISKYIFKNFKNVKYVFGENSYQILGTYEKSNHFRIELPDSIVELDRRLSSKGRYNIRREKRILSQTFDSFVIEKHNAFSAESLPLWDKYFEFKAKTHDHVYGMTPKEYCDTFHVTTIYSLAIGEEKKIIALVLSCEQCPIVYIENLSYDITYSKYSPGQVLYDEYLKSLVLSNKKEIFLLGGDYDYKRRYGSIEEEVYNFSYHKYEWIKKLKIK